MLILGYIIIYFLIGIVLAAGFIAYDKEFQDGSLVCDDEEVGTLLMAILFWPCVLIVAGIIAFGFAVYKFTILLVETFSLVLKWTRS